ncbi:MAG: molecular chaperone GrpE [Parcubacteria group bacterium Athens0714_16]|nr:MAG: molecular chaperone GrpE [Parcubacteria group bacterium Athens0714_16]
MFKKNKTIDISENNENVVEENENFEIEGIEESTEIKIKKIKENLKKCENEKKEYLDGWQRSKAELINFKKGTELSKKELLLFANENLIVEIINVLDSFNMAFSNKDHWEKVDENWRKGVEYIYNQLLNTLKNFGVEVINPIKEKFNPSYHISVDSMDVENEKEDHIILEVLQNGYNLNGKNVRPARVKIGIYKGHK